MGPFREAYEKYAGGKMEYWYALTNEDIQTVADDLNVKLTRSQIRKIKEIAPGYLNWFDAIESAIHDVIKPQNCDPS